jgi:hypothetical protein
MNERIRELSKEAYEATIRNTPSMLVTREHFENNFAMAIITECSNVAGKHVRDGDIDIAEIIRRHFGVEK